MESKSRIEDRIAGTTTGADATATPATQKALFDTPEEKMAATKTLEIIKQYERLRRSSDLKDPEVQKEIVAKVKEALQPAQGVLTGIADQVDVAKVVKETTYAFVELSIDIPRIIVLPTGDVTSGYEDFDLDVRAIRYQPVSNEILVQNLHDHARYRLRSGGNLATEARLEDYLVFGLVDHDDISYDDHAELLYKLSGQCVQHLRSYLKDDDEVLNVLKAHQKDLVRSIYTQMDARFDPGKTELTAKITKGFQTIRSPLYTQESGQRARPYRVPVEEKQLIRGMLFEGFRKALFSPVKFDSDSERRFSVVLENDGEVLKWFKSAKGVFQIRYNRNDEEYVPDFAVETKAAKFLCEPKRADDVDDDVVLAKAKAAALWCKHATEHGDKPWSYLLIPHNVIDESKTLAWFAASFMYGDFAV